MGFGNSHPPGDAIDEFSWGKMQEFKVEDLIDIFEVSSWMGSTG